MMNRQASHPERLDQLAHGLAIGLWIALAVIITVKTIQNPDNHNTYPIYRDARMAWWNGENVYDTFFFGSDYRYGPSFRHGHLAVMAWLPFDLAGAVIWAAVERRHRLLGDGRDLLPHLARRGDAAAAELRVWRN